jgi:PrtD family type I secretion system ABC transporter
VASPGNKQKSDYYFMSTRTNIPPKTPLEARFFWFKRLRSMVLFSFIINLLYLTSPLFMMQIYDRVLASANIPTLVGLLLITSLLFLFFGLLDYIRSQALSAHGEVTADSLAEKAYSTSVLNNCDKSPSREKKRALADVASLRSFLTSPTFAAFFDLPWAPIFLLVIFGLHPMLGLFAVIACIILAALALLNERLSRKQLQEATGLSIQATERAYSAQRNAVALRGNGMVDNMKKHWQKSDAEARKVTLKGTNINGRFSTTTKTLRMMIQSLMLGLGAYYVIKGELSSGSIIACTVILSRALSPLESILGNYSSVVRARDSWDSIKTWLFEEDVDTDKHELPAPKASLSIQELSVFPPNDNTKFIIKNIQLTLKAGDVLGISGHSGSGKSTLAKALVAAWPAAKGKVCLDGADILQWTRTQLGQHIGYLPQEIELFDGTVTENIARFSDDDDFAKVLTASELAGTHQLILELKEGYNTRLGPEGHALSSGQKQRIALARALYNNPFLIVLDEPNSNLDNEGEQRLNNTIGLLQKQNRIVVFISHRPQLLEKANMLLIMQKGEMMAFGSPADIVNAAKKQQNQTNPNTQPTNRRQL